MMHPCFRIPKSSDWNWNDSKHRQERVLWNYLGSHEVQIDAHQGKKQAEKIVRVPFIIIDHFKLI